MLLDEGSLKTPFAWLRDERLAMLQTIEKCRVR